MSGTNTLGKKAWIAIRFILFGLVGLWVLVFFTFGFVGGIIGVFEDQSDLSEHLVETFLYLLLTIVGALMMLSGRSPYLRRIRGSLVGAFVLLALDAGMSGSFLTSILSCPLWFIVSLVKAIIQRPGWKVGLSRILVPALTLGLVLGNAALQSRIATANAERIIAACEQFRLVSGRYPSKLDELTPQYLGTVPRAKRSLVFNNFWYSSFEGKTLLWWAEIPPFGRKIYNFERRLWYTLD